MKFFKTEWHQVASEFNYDIPEEEIPSPGQIVSYIEQLPESEQAKALAIVNNWFDNLED